MTDNIARVTRHSPHNALTAAHAAALLKEPTWEQAITVAVARAYQDNVAVELSPGTYMTRFPRPSHFDYNISKGLTIAIK